MGKVYDLTAKISNDKPVIKMGDKEFEVNDNHKTVLIVQSQLEGKKEGEVFDFVFSKLLGEKSKKEIDAMELSFSSIKTVFIAVMAAASGEEFEVVEKRFQSFIQ